MPESQVDIRQVGGSLSRKLARLGAVRRKKARLQTQLNDRQAALTARYGPAIEELAKEETELIAEMLEACSRYFKFLVVPGTKMIKLRSGDILLRLSPLKLVIAEGMESHVIQQLRRRAVLGRYTKLKRTVDKVALKKDPGLVAKLDGASLEQEEKLYLKPRVLQGEEIDVATAGHTFELPEED